MFRKILENGHLQVIVPIKFRTVSSRHRMLVPGATVDGTEPLAVALARAFRWQKYIDEGKFRNSVALADAIGLDKSIVAKILRLRFLSPAIVHRIVTGDIPRSLTLKDLRTAFPDVWSEQEERWFGGRHGVVGRGMSLRDDQLQEFRIEA